MPNKVLTVAVPAYNMHTYLRRCLDTMARDCFADDLQVVIVNDGSTDDTADIASSYVERFPTIFELVNKENGGHGSAVNAALDVARGSYFRIVDGDDWVHSENLETLLDILRDEPADMVIDEKREVNLSTGVQQHFKLPDYVELDRSIDFESICARDDVASYIMLHTFNVRTELVNANRIRVLEHTFYVDYEFIVKATSYCTSVLFLDLEIYRYLVGNTAQSMDSANMVRRYDHHDRVVREILRFVAAREAEGVSPERSAYLRRKVVLAIHTQYNIALIFDDDRERGRRRAEELRAFLSAEYPEYLQMTDRRYRRALALHYLGFDAERLNRLMGRP